MQFDLCESLDHSAGDGLSPVGFSAAGKLGAAAVLDAEIVGADAIGLCPVGIVGVAYALMAGRIMGGGHVPFFVGTAEPKRFHVVGFPALAAFGMDFESADAAAPAVLVENSYAGELG